MSGPAGDLENLEPSPSGGAVRAVRKTDPARLTTHARIALFLGVTIFTVGALIQLLAAAWLGLLLLLFGGSAEVLVHSGGLEPRTFAVCSIAAVVLDAVLLIALAASSVRRWLRRASPSPERERFRARHPVAAVGLGLSGALAFVLGFGWSPSPYFPYPLATVVVLANAYYFGLVGLLVFARLADLAWRQVKAWGLSSQYRAGFLTASLALIGAAGYWLLTTRWYEAPLHAIEAQLEAEDLEDNPGVLSLELEGLCLVAGNLEPSLARSSAASACGFLTSGTKPLDDCFSALMTGSVPEAKKTLSRRDLNAYDLDDAIMKAVLATCTRKPRPRDLGAYFYTVARNQLRQMAKDARRTVSCERLDDHPAACAASESSDLREWKLARLWEDAFCNLTADAAEIVRRRLEQDESFREIGVHVGLTETRAKDTFHNAIKKLRSQALASSSAS